MSGCAVIYFALPLLRDIYNVSFLLSGQHCRAPVHTPPYTHVFAEGIGEHLQFQSVFIPAAKSPAPSLLQTLPGSPQGGRAPRSLGAFRTEQSFLAPFCCRRFGGAGVGRRGICFLFFCLPFSVKILFLKRQTSPPSCPGGSGTQITILNRLKGADLDQVCVIIELPPRGLGRHVWGCSGEPHPSYSVIWFM